MDQTNYLNPSRLKARSERPYNDPRNEFESDFGRVIFSPAIRRMHDKTQVFPLTTDDNIHSRLTHSMEVLSIGYSLGLRICSNVKFLAKIGREQNDILREIPIVLEIACLVHDIGNPPFGHFGETAIQSYFSNLFQNQNFKLIRHLKKLYKANLKEYDQIQLKHFGKIIYPTQAIKERIDILQISTKRIR